MKRKRVVTEKMEEMTTIRPSPIDIHLHAAALLLADEDTCVQLGPWRIEQHKDITGGSVGWYVIEQRAALRVYLFANWEDARSVCAVLNRNEKIRSTNSREMAVPDAR